MEEKPSIWKHSLNSGLIIGLIMVVWTLILYIAQLEQIPVVAMLAPLIISIIGIVWTHKQYKKNGDGVMSYSQGLGLGTLAIGIAGVVNGVFTYIYISFIDSSVMERASRALEEQRIKLLDEGLAQAQVDQVMNIQEMMFQPGVMFISGILGSLFFGFILSLIVSLFTKEEKAVGIVE